MPTINKPIKKLSNYNHNRNIAQKQVYNTTRWKSLRLLKIQNNPLCEECLKNDKVTTTVEVHHIQPFLTGKDLEQIKFLGFDYNNLMSLCTECHENKHKK